MKDLWTALTYPCQINSKDLSKQRSKSESGCRMGSETYSLHPSESNFAEDFSSSKKESVLILYSVN